MLLTCLLAGLQLHRATRNGRLLRIGDHTVLLSDRFGPAVMGFIRPRIVLPLWLAEQDTSLRIQVLRHEREHIAAHDQRVLLAALLLVAACAVNAPQSPPIRAEVQNRLSQAFSCYELTMLTRRCSNAPRSRRRAGSVTSPESSTGRRQKWRT
jgi:hypothetical protein